MRKIYKEGIPLETQFDAIVIGGGPGGYVCAAKLAQAGKKTALIEKTALGGTCLNRGCIPTKTLLHAAELLEEAKKAASAGIHIEGATVDYPALRQRKQEVVQQLTSGIEKMLSAAKVTVIAGNGYVPKAGQVQVTDAEGTGTLYTAQDIVVAVGSEPAMPPIVGLDLPGVMTSNDLLQDIPQLNSLVVIGGGVIGMEFASLYASLGTKVTVLEGQARILPPLDREIGQSLAMLMKKRGVTIVTNAMVQRVEQTEQNTLCCHYMVKEKEEMVAGQRVLVSVGRKSLASGVLAPELPIAYERGRVQVDENMQSSVPHIYVIGDAAAGYPQLAHAASAQALDVVAAITQQSFETDLHLVPSCVYTSPEIASVGMTEAEAKSAGIHPHIGKYPMTANGKSLLTEQERGFIKLVADENGVLLGAQLMCARATDMIGELTLAIANGLTEEQVASMIRPHPTFEEGIGEALSACIRKNPHAKSLAD